eukprot:TRINITY_DN5749_c0_g1_i1.p1 TRINITY_DN5749_c0_g1~~TRINITY_DN5749_c0_g1_i1.p1  ORF type:complete len:142 (-),score=38.90 TRINITY_DN5749_c0_g1_i1:190-615(-)
MHICFQRRYDAQRALFKHGLQLSPYLIIGVKLIDPNDFATLPLQEADQVINGGNRLRPSSLLFSSESPSLANSTNGATNGVMTNGIHGEGQGKDGGGGVAERPVMKSYFVDGSGSQTQSMANGMQPPKKGLARLVDYVFGV